MELNIPTLTGLTPHQVVTLSRARNFSQYLSMRQAYLDGKCLFCDPLGPKNVVIHEVDGWRMWVNPFPEKHTSLHLVMASVRHIPTEELPGVEDIAAMGKLFAWAREHFGHEKLKGGGLFSRFGDPMLNAGTILHLHGHIMVPDLSGEVRLPLAKSPDRDARGYRRIDLFEKLRRVTSLSGLTDEEIELLEQDADSIEKEFTKIREGAYAA